MKCIDCVSQANNTWSSVTSAGYKINSAGNKGIFVNCKALDEDNAFYVSDNDGAITLIDCGVNNCTAAKGGVSPAPSDWKIVYTGEIVVGEATGKYILDLVEDDYE